MGDLRVRRVTAVTMDDAMTVIEDAAIVVSGARLVYVGPTAGEPPLRPGEQVIDGAGRVALPGLINAHTHLGMMLFRGAADNLSLAAWLEEAIWPAEARLTGEDVYWASLLGIAEMFRAGVTAFNDMYYHLEQVADAVRESGIRAGLAGVVIGTVPGGLLERAIARVGALAEEGHPRITPFFGPHAPYTVPAEMLHTVIEKAAELGVGIHTHLSETRGEVARSQAAHGRTPIAYMRDLGLFSVPVTAAHCVYPTPEEIALLVERGARIVHCPCSNMKLASGIAPVPAFLEAGATVALGTDGAGSNNTLDVFREVRQAALLHKVHGDATAVTAPQALWMATRGGAAALGQRDLGSLESGKLADLILLDFTAPHLTPSGRVLSHLVYAAAGADVETVIVHGEVVMAERRLLTLDLARIRARVNEAAARLFG